MSDANIFPLGVQQIFKKSLILHVMLKSKHCKFNLHKKLVLLLETEQWQCMGKHFSVLQQVSKSLLCSCFERSVPVLHFLRNGNQPVLPQFIVGVSPCPDRCS